MLFALLGIAPLQAQQVPAQLTLEDAQRLARLYSPLYRKTENDIGVADASIRSAYGAFLPSLSSSLGFGASGSSNLTGTDDFGGVVGGSRRIESRSSSSSQGISAGFTIFDGGQQFRNLGIAKAQRIATEANIAGIVTTLAASVARDYYNAVSARRQVDLEMNVLAAKQDALQQTEKLMAVAARKYIDVLQARVDVASAQQVLEDAKGNAEKARLQLKSRIGIEGDAGFELATPLPEPFDPSKLDASAIVQQAFAHSPLILAQIEALNVADKRASNSRARRWPTFRGNASFGRGSNAQGYTDGLGDFNPPNRNWGFGVSMSLPIFSNFTTSATIATDDATESDAREDLRQRRLEVDRDVRSALIDLQSAYRRVESAERQAALQRELLAAARDEYRLGTVDFFRLQQITQSADQAERAVLQARLTFANGLTVLEERVGAPVIR